MYKVVYLVFVYLFVFIHGTEIKKPTVLISILARNKAHTLPYFLSLLERLDYPKDRISLWIQSDHNSDHTFEVLQKWVSVVEGKYHSIDVHFKRDVTEFPDAKGIAHWSEERFSHIISLRESALNDARNRWADYYFTIDCDIFLTNPNTLNDLISRNVTVVSPMLKSDGLYSNFWYGMTDDYYYLRTDDYKLVLNKEKKGCFNVPMIHSCVLIDLRKKESDLLTYNPSKVDNYDGPHDDIITFALAANKSSVPLHLCNDYFYGFVMVPLEETDNLEHDYQQLTNLKLDALNQNELLYVNDLLKPFTSQPKKDTLGFDQIYMINLLRRPKRRKRMLQCFDELGLDVTILDAVDGKLLNESFLQKIKFMPNYADPYHKRPMTLGEIGCFLSHFNIWKEVVEKNYAATLILEDDIRFESFFRLKVQHLMEEAHRINDWDLIYFGRKRLQESDEPWVRGSKYLVEAGYSYWTLGYALSFRGAKKLLDGDPLSRLVPVDEYLPILFDKHPKVDWKGHFPQRDLVALSAAPLLLYPTHYTGEAGYISDTEDSVTIKNAIKRDDL